MGVLISYEKLSSLRDTVKSPFYFTTGVYDLLHDGHIAHLNYCRHISLQQEERGLVIVAICDDATVRVKKGCIEGIQRPFLPQEIRAETVADLPTVDYVVINRPNGQEAPYYRLISMLRPDYWIMPRDGISKEKQKICSELGVIPIEVGRVPPPYKSGISTTQKLQVL